MIIKRLMATIVSVLATGGVAFVLACLVAWGLRVAGAEDFAGLCASSGILMLGIAGLWMWPALDNRYTAWWHRVFKVNS
jgi:hypothetical protein